jgi:hypothetical protein
MTAFMLSFVSLCISEMGKLLAPFSVGPDLWWRTFQAELSIKDAVL